MYGDPKGYWINRLRKEYKQIMAKAAPAEAMLPKVAPKGAVPTGVSPKDKAVFRIEEKPTPQVASTLRESIEIPLLRQIKEREVTAGKGDILNALVGDETYTWKVGEPWVSRETEGRPLWYRIDREKMKTVGVEGMPSWVGKTEIVGKLPAGDKTQIAYLVHPEPGILKVKRIFTIIGEGRETELREYMDSYKQRGLKVESGLVDATGRFTRQAEPGETTLSFMGTGGKDKFKDIKPADPTVRKQYEQFIAAVKGKYEGKMPKRAGPFNPVVYEKLPEDAQWLGIGLVSEKAKRVPMEYLNKEADKILADPIKTKQTIDRITKTGTANAIDQRVILKYGGNKIKTAHERWRRGEINTEQFQTELSNLQITPTSPEYIASRGAGLALRARRDPVGTYENLMHFYSLLEKKGVPKWKLEELRKIDPTNPVAIEEWMKTARPSPSTLDLLYEYFYFNILSGPPTHAQNHLSNTFWWWLNLGQRGISGGLDFLGAKLKGLDNSQRTYFASEIIPMIMGRQRAKPKARQAFLDVMRGKQPKVEYDLASKWEKEIGGSIRAWETHPNKWVRENMGPVFSSVRRLLTGADLHAKILAMDAFLEGRMHSDAMRAGVKPWSTEYYKFKDKWYKTEVTQPVMQEGTKEVQMLTFQDEPGTLARAVLKARQDIPFSRFFVPFVNVVASITRQGARLIPAAGYLEPGLRQMPKSMAAAKQLMGLMLTWYIGKKWAQGEITLSVPREPGNRDLFYSRQKLPFGIKFGDTWYSWRRWEPIALPIFVTATTMQRLYEGFYEGKAAEDVILGLGNDLLNYFLDSTFFQAPAKLLNPLTRQNYMEWQLTSMIPLSGFLKSIARETEYLLKGKVIVKDREGLMDNIKSIIPVWADTLPKRLNVFGEEAELPGGYVRQILPYKYSKESPDPTYTELERLGRAPGPISKSFTYKGIKVELDDADYRQLVKLTGKAMKRTFDQIVKTEEYQNIKDTEFLSADDRKIKLLQTQGNKVRTKIKKAFIEQRLGKYLKQHKEEKERAPFWKRTFGVSEREMLRENVI